MTAQVALLRGVNVGSSTQVAMSALADLLVQQSYRDVRTLLRSGNVVFGSDRTLTAADVTVLEEAFATNFGFRAGFVVLSAAQFAEVVELNPLSARPDPSRILIDFVPWGTKLQDIQTPAPEEIAPEQVVIGEHALYQWCPHGVSKSALPGAFWKQFGATPVTARNFNTVGKILTLLDQVG